MSTENLIDALSLTAEAMGQQLTPAGLLLMADDLAEYPLDDVLGALRRVRRECRRLTVADVMERMAASDGRPDSDEAWMVALSAQHESATVVWTRETEMAWHIARPAIYDQQQYLYDRDAVARQHKTTVEGLQATIDAYEQRLGILMAELEKAQTPEQRPRKTSITPTLRANFEHVSQLLGRQVTENDLTLITGIGPKTAALLQSNQINTWDDLANAPLEKLQQILQDAGGIYKAQDPSHWAKQAVMASRGEWRKLRVYQEALRKNEKNG